MTALTKAEMADHLSELTSLNRREAKQMVELFFDEISQALIAGEQVKLSGFGNFELRDKRERPDVIQKQVRKFRFLPVEWLRLGRARNLDSVLEMSRSIDLLFYVLIFNF